jgi:hypothetical protein
MLTPRRAALLLLVLSVCSYSQILLLATHPQFAGICKFRVYGRQALLIVLEHCLASAPQWAVNWGRRLCIATPKLARQQVPARQYKVNTVRRMRLS